MLHTSLCTTTVRELARAPLDLASLRALALSRSRALALSSRALVSRTVSSDEWRPPIARRRQRWGATALCLIAEKIKVRHAPEVNGAPSVVPLPRSTTTVILSHREVVPELGGPKAGELNLALLPRARPTVSGGFFRE